MPRAHVVPDGAKIAALRGEADLTQWELARQAGYGLRTIGKIEGGRPTGAKTLSAAATVLSRRLQRPIAMTDLIVHGNGYRNGHGPTIPAAALVAENVRFLDLGACRAPAKQRNGHGSDSGAILTDHYRFHRWPTLPGPLVFRYRDPAITGAVSLSHALSGQWHGDIREMHVDVERRTGEGGVVQNRLAYSAIEPCWSTTVALPSDCLTLLVLFPETRRCQGVTGRYRPHDSDTWQSTPPGPACFADGKLACWRIPAPPAGMTYRLEWEW